MTRRPSARWLVRLGAAAFVVAATLGVVATAAVAHATLESTTPAQSAVFPAGDPPKAVTLVFDAVVTASPSSIGVYDSGGHPVRVVAHRGSVTSKRISAGLPRLADGSYVVVWHVVSDDGHPEHGAFTFAVGASTGTTADIGQLLASRSSGRTIGVGFGVDRALAFLGCLVFLGGLVFVRWLWPAALGSSDVRRLLVTAAGVAIAATLLSVLFEAAYSTGGGVSAMFDGTALRAVMHARFGSAAVTRVFALSALTPFVVLRTRRPRSATGSLIEGIVTVLALVVLATFAYAGHANTGRFVVLGFATDLAHLGAAAFWLGGIVTLALTLRNREETESTARAAWHFSRIALPAVAVIVVSGVIQGWRQVDTWWALWHTEYGRLLVVKVLVVVAVVIVASATRDEMRDRIVPALRRALGVGSSTAVIEDDAVAQLRNGIWAEVLLAVVVLAATAALVVTAPGREAQAAADRPSAHTLRVVAAGNRLTHSVVVQPALPGENSIVVTPRLRHPGGFLPLELTGKLRRSAKSAVITVTFTPLDGGRWVATASLPTAGTWHLDLTDPTDPTRDTARAQFRIG